MLPSVISDYLGPTAGLRAHEVLSPDIRTKKPTQLLISSEVDLKYTVMYLDKESRTIILVKKQNSPGFHIDYWEVHGMQQLHVTARIILLIRPLTLNWPCRGYPVQFPCASRAIRPDIVSCQVL